MPYFRLAITMKGNNIITALKWNVWFNKGINLFEPFSSVTLLKCQATSTFNEVADANYFTGHGILNEITFVVLPQCRLLWPVWRDKLSIIGGYDKTLPTLLKGTSKSGCRQNIGIKNHPRENRSLSVFTVSRRRHTSGDQKGQ